MPLATLFAIIARHKKADEPSDEELMIAYAAGDVAAFQILYDRHERPVYRFLLRSLARPELAEEFAQEVFVRVIRAAPTYERRAKFKTWLYTIARNLLIDGARRRAARPRTESIDRPLGDDPGAPSRLDRTADERARSGDVASARAEFRDALAGALDELPDEQREVFLLKEVAGLKFREIAEAVDAPIPTVKSRMRYALAALRGHLAAWHEVRFDEEDREAAVLRE